MPVRVPSQLIVQARREFARVAPTSTSWRHPRYGYVARAGGKTFWAFTSEQPTPSTALRSPSGHYRMFRSVDGAIAALVRHRVEVNTARVMQQIDDAKTRRADREIAHLDRKAPR